jgi:hypothetical protein
MIASYGETSGFVPVDSGEQTEVNGGGLLDFFEKVVLAVLSTTVVVAVSVKTSGK